MSERDVRLLPRLLHVLDTVEADAEIANTVRRVRRTIGDGGFASLIVERPIPLRHEEQEIAVRLRALGFMLRGANHPMPPVNEALHRTSEALIESDEVQADDLLLTLACVRDLLAYATAHIQAEPSEQREPGGLSELIESLHRRRD